MKVEAMPIYEYHCSVCGCTFEKLRRMEDADKDLVCPKCYATEVERLLSSFATGSSGSGNSGCGGGSRFS
jgi:putative FmdB family regulatory protein